MQPSYLVNLANIIHLTEGILVPLTSCYRCRCRHCGRRVWWIHYGYWAKREWLHRLGLTKHLYAGTVSQVCVEFSFSNVWMMKLMNCCFITSKSQHAFTHH